MNRPQNQTVAMIGVVLMALAPMASSAVPRVRDNFV